MVNLMTEREPSIKALQTACGAPWMSHRQWMSAGYFPGNFTGRQSLAVLAPGSALARTLSEAGDLNRPITCPSCSVMFDMAVSDDVETKLKLADLLKDRLTEGVWRWTRAMIHHTN